MTKKDDKAISIMPEQPTANEEMELKQIV